MTTARNGYIPCLLGIINKCHMINTKVILTLWITQSNQWVGIDNTDWTYSLISLPINNSVDKNEMKIMMMTIHSRQRVPNPPTLPIPLPQSLTKPPATHILQTLSSFRFLWLKGWLRNIWCVLLLNDIMDLQMPNLGTLLPEVPCGVFYPTRRQFAEV